MRYVVFAVLILVVWRMLANRRRRAASTVIGPRVLLLDLGAGADEALVAADRKMYFAVGFTDVAVATRLDDLRRDVCDVLHVLGRGELAYQELLDRLGAANPKLVVLASDAGDAPIAKGQHPFNLVITLARKGDGFGSFFAALYARMFRGKGIVWAWLELAPQDEHVPAPDEPLLVFIPRRPWFGLTFAPVPRRHSSA